MTTVRRRAITSAIAIAIAWVTAIAASAPSSASAQDPSAHEVDGEDARGDRDEAPGALLERHREVPDYDGLPEPGPDAGEVLLWIPRVLFAPITLVLDYGLRRPLGWLATTAEREGWPTLLLDALTWNERRSGIVPSFLLAYGLQPTGGLRLFSNDDIAPGHSLDASISYGGNDFVQGAASYTVRTSGDRVRGTVGGTGARRPDLVFSGIGWDADAVQYRYRSTWYAADAELAIDFWRESRLVVRAGIDGHEYDADGYAALSDSPSLEDAIQSGRFEVPYGLAGGYVAYRQRLELAIDSRELEPAPGHGVRIEGHGELAVDPGDPSARRWVRWGAAAGAFVDLGHHRVIGVWGLAHFADPIGSAPLPFEELVALGQDALLMQGFLRGQLRGRSGVATTLEYVYPIWTRLDGRLHVSVGNVFGEHLEDFAFERLRVSFGIGIATAGDPDSALHFALAAGTAPFVEGATIDSVQLLVGTRRGF